MRSLGLGVIALVVASSALGGCSSEDGGTADNGGGAAIAGTSGKSGGGGAGGSGGISVGGGGGVAGSGAGGISGSGNALCGLDLTGTVRDFSDAHPDFEDFVGDGELGIVDQTLGSDQKPVYVDTPHQFTTTKANFDQWFRDVTGVNVALPFSFKLTQSGNIYTYDNGEFYPVDNQGLGNEGRIHNYHFTFELHTKFVYQGGETFTFTGDDDLWTFINGKLAIDLGGVHPSKNGSVSLDQIAASFGLSVGNIYSLDVFQAERHTDQSHFRIDTSLKFTNCGEPPK